MRHTVNNNKCLPIFFETTNVLDGLILFISVNIYTKILLITQSNLKYILIFVASYSISYKSDSICLTYYSKPASIVLHSIALTTAS